MVKVKIDGREVSVSEGTTILEAARTAGLQPTGAVSVSEDWNGLRLLSRGRGR